MKYSLLVMFITTFSCTSIFSQSSSTQANANPTINWDNFELELDNLDTDWTFHTDQENRVLYIDFEALGGNMSKLVMVDKQDEIVVMDDHLFDLPINTIYEIDLAKLSRGSYSLELHTYNSIIKEEIIIQ